MVPFSTVPALISLFLLLFSLALPSKAEEDRCTNELDNVPYITFMGQRLPNHTFVDVDLLRDLPNNSLQCHTDLVSCCGASGSGHSGEWILPNGDVIGAASGVGYGVREQSQRLDLVYSEDTDTDGDTNPRISGIYHCNVSTNAENDVGNTARASVYVGLYAVESLYISDVFVTENADVNGDSPQFTITCVSVGGPVGCVVWRINKEIIPNPNATSTLVDPVGGVYVHNLTVSEVRGGSYSCSVANNKPTSEYEGLFVEYAETPLYVLAVPFGPTSVHVIWGTKQPLKKKTLGYRIYYRGPTNGSVDIEDSGVNDWVITGLKNNGTYRVFVAGKSRHLPSQRQESNLVHLVPGEPELQLYSATPDTVSFSWRLHPGSVVDSFQVKWDRNHSQFSTFRDTLSNSTHNYTVTGLKDYDNATYTITVTAFNAVGSSTSSNMNFVANFVNGDAGGSEVPENGVGESEGIDEGLIAGVVVAGLVIIAIATVILGLMVYHYKSKSKKNSKKTLYSLAGQSAGVSTSVPIPPPRPDIQTVGNRSYAPSVTTFTTTNAVTRDEDSQYTGYYTPMGYIYPNPHPPQQSTAANNTNGDRSTSAVGQDEMNRPGHGYEYITVEK